jgi:aspartate--ammonia ligase
VLLAENRNEAYLRRIVKKIYSAILRTEFYICETYAQLKHFLPEDIHFIHSEELLRMYPDKTAKEREHLICQKYGAVFIIGIGGKLSNGEAHDLRAPDYDDWDLNGDIMFWDDLLGTAMEISSMGIRVSPESMDKQLTLAGCDERRELPYHKALLAGELPLTIGGGIGQSRLSMLLLGKAHIGEVQASIWDSETQEICEKAGIVLL